MSDLIRQLTLGAGLNTPEKICDYLQIARSTWYKKQKEGNLSRCERDALRHKAGYLLHDKFRNYRIYEDRIYSQKAGFATACEIENMDLIRQFQRWSIDRVDETEIKKSEFSEVLGLKYW